MIPETGTIIINKPIGCTSHDIVNLVRRQTGVARVGHAGTLDPLASGVLIILVGREATKCQTEFMNFPKEYVAEVTFGVRSATFDAEGPLTVTATPVQLAKLTTARLKKILPLFVGKIQQQPPIFSAIKIKGKPSYRYARRHVSSHTLAIQTEKIHQLAARTVQIDSIKLLKFTRATKKSPAYQAMLKINCQKGVYVRSLANDLGDKLGVGAYLSSLTRTAIGPYKIKNACSPTPDGLQQYLDNCAEKNQN